MPAPCVFRCLLDGPASGAGNMARDAAILEQVAAGQVPPTVRIYQWAQPTVTVGYGQRLAASVNLGACQEDGVPVIRRMSGGGAVLHAAEITYSIMVPRSNALVQGAVPACFAAMCQPLVAALQQLGVMAVFKPVNDLLVNGRKISGCAQVRRGSGVLQHGTLLLQVDAALMQRYLRPVDPPKPHSVQLTDMYRECGAAACAPAFVRSFAAVFFDCCARSWQVTMDTGVCTPAELSRAQQLEQDLFRQQKWNREKGCVGADRHLVDLDCPPAVHCP